MFTVHVSAGPGKARVAQFLGRMATPNCLLYTRRGTPVHISADIIADMPLVQALQLTLPDLSVVPGITASKSFKHYRARQRAMMLGQDGVEQQEQHDQASSSSSYSPAAAAPAAGGGGAGSVGKGDIQDFLHLNGFVLHLSMRDTMANPVGSANNSAVHLTSHTGRREISPADHMNLVACFRPHLFAALSDEVRGDVSQSRADKSVKRTLAWLDAEIEGMRELKQQYADQGDTDHVPLLFATIQGAGHARYRDYCATQIATKSVDGYVLGGFGLGESPDQRRELMELVISKLPDELPRMLGGKGNPIDVLDAVERGVDLFEACYPLSVTEMGCASSYSITPLEPTSTRTGSKVNLWDKVYSKDTTPLLEGCTCFACTNHTKAYVHHLLNTHEMLASVLLQVHNVHHYAVFFEQIRAHIEASTFTEFKGAFIERFVQ